VLEIEQTVDRKLEFNEEAFCFRTDELRASVAPTTRP